MAYRRQNVEKRLYIRGSVSSPDLVLLLAAGVDVDATSESVVILVLSDVVAPIIVDEPSKSIWHVISELAFVDPVVVLGPPTEATPLSLLVCLAFVLVRKSLVSEVVGDFLSLVDRDLVAIKVRLKIEWA